MVANEFRTAGTDLFFTLEAFNGQFALEVPTHDIEVIYLDGRFKMLERGFFNWGKTLAGSLEKRCFAKEAELG